MRIRAICGWVVCGFLAACSSSPGNDLMTSSECASLDACCAQLTGASQTTCASVVTSDVDVECSATLSTYMAGGQCGGAPSTAAACTGLAACCVHLTGTEQVDCQGIVTANVAPTCTADLAAYQTAKLCGAGVTPGGPTDAGTGFPGQHDATLPDGGGILFIDATLADVGVIVGFDAGGLPDTGGGGCGTCRADCTDGCGDPCSGGACATMCVPSCTTDQDCASSCPALADVTNCCDLTTNACYAASGNTCPVPVTEPDAGQGY